MPKVSICIPTYNQIKYLKKNLDSILEQDFTDYEVIVTDDTPNDTIKEFVLSYRKVFDGKLRYYKNVRVLGSPENWNEAIKKANGKYIKIMHHDDWFNDKGSLYEFVKMLDENKQAPFAFSSAIAVNVESNATWIHTPTIEKLLLLNKNPHCLFFENFIGPPSSTIYRKENSNEFDKNLKWVVDIDFYMAILKSNRNFAFTKKPLITCITGADHSVTNICQNKETMIFEYIYLYKKTFKFPSIKHIHFFSVLLRSYNIKNISEITQICNFALPLLIRLLILYENIRLLNNKILGYKKNKH